MSPRESLALNLDVTALLGDGDSVDDFEVALYSEAGTSLEDVTDENLTGTGAESAGVITSPLISGLVKNSSYILRFLVTIGTLVYDYYIHIRCV